MTISYIDSLRFKFSVCAKSYKSIRMTDHPSDRQNWDLQFAERWKEIQKEKYKPFDGEEFARKMLENCPSIYIQTPNGCALIKKD